MSKLNDKFTGTPEADETEAQRVARLRIKAETQAAQEFDEDAVTPSSSPRPATSV
ncbi:MAG: hypothetical protein IPM06_21435 [Rhizobiales bacterium]|nr:hypothetical protein [Hyphomicrobiales bacterium]